MKTSKHSSQVGFSMVELLIVITITVILATFAVMQLGGSRQNLQRQNVAREFKVSLERARFDSVKRRANECSSMSRVTIAGPTIFSVTTDLNQNGTLETSETQTVNFASTSDVRIVGSGVTLPVTIRFNERGNAVLSDCVSTPTPNVPLLYFCNGPCTPETATAQNSNVLFVSATGTVAMLNGGESMPTFTNPTVSNVNSQAQINPLLAHWAPYTPPTPTPTPTPSPSPSPTPSPAPTPYFCRTSQPYEKPSETGCTCKAPQWVRADKWCK